MKRLCAAWLGALGLSPAAVAEFRVEPYLQLVQQVLGGRIEPCRGRGR